MKKLLLLSLILCRITAISVQSQTLDTTFGIGGKVVTPISGFKKGTKCAIHSVAVQSDGKIVGVGTASNPVYKNCLIIIRYNVDGSTDTGFNGTGQAFIPGISGYSVAIQKDGKIVVGATNDSGRLCILRFNVSGTLDSSFNKTGFNLVKRLFIARRLLIKSNGQIIVGGSNYESILLASFNSDGSIYKRFGNNGFAEAFYGQSTFGGCQLDNINIFPNGDLIVAGDWFLSWDTSASWNWGTLDKFDSLGNHDSTYSHNAYHTLNWTYMISSPFGFYQRDSSFLILGMNLRKITSNGSVDSSYGNKKMVFLKFSNYYYDAIQIDSSILGCSYNDSAFGFTRYFINGQWDSTFGTKGIVKTLFGKTQSVSVTIAAQKDGKIILGGSADSNVALTKYVIPGLTVTAVAQPILPQGTLKLYPNPFSYAATLEYTLAHEENISIDIYDMEGKLIRQILPACNMEKGVHRQLIHLGDNVASGNYIMMLRSEEGNKAIKIIKN